MWRCAGGRAGGGAAVDHRHSCIRWRPYRVERTGSLPTSEVKRRRARLVLGWGTAREDLRVLPALHLRRQCAGTKPMQDVHLFNTSTCGLVAMTSASHAEGRQFDPGQVYFI
jgi:hypothetical protein